MTAVPSSLQTWTTSPQLGWAAHSSLPQHQGDEEPSAGLAEGFLCLFVCFNFYFLNPVRFHVKTLPTALQL